MSSAAGRRRSPKRSPSASTVSATSSSESVVCVITAIGLPPESSFAASSGDSTTTVASGPLAARADHLDVVGVADERDEVAAVGVAPRLGVHLRDERADGVDDAQAAALAVLPHRRRDAVRREDADRAGRDLVLVLDEHRAEPLEPADDVVVVDDLVADVDRRPVLLEQASRRSRSRGRRRRRTSAARRAGPGLSRPPLRRVAEPAERALGVARPRGRSRAASGRRRGARPGQS